MKDFKATKIESIVKRKLRATEYRITFWDDGGDYAQYTTIVGAKIEAKTVAKWAKKSLFELGIIPGKCKTTIEKSF